MAMLVSIKQDIAEIKGQIMALSQAMLDAFAAMDQATTELAARIDALLAQLGQGNDAEIIQKIQDETAKLRTFAADPTNPIP